MGLAGLLVLASDYLESRREPPTPGIRLGLGQLHYVQGFYREGLAFLDQEMGGAEGPADLWALRRLTEAARLCSDWDSACAWGLRAGTAGDWKPVRALAIQMEHRERDFQGALRVVEAVLRAPELAGEKEDWRHRGRRLIRKGARPAGPWPEE